DPHYRRVRDRRREPQQCRLRYSTATAMMKAVIIVLLCPGSKPCRAPSARQQQPDGRGTGLQQIGQRRHGKSLSEILRDRLELLDRRALFARQRADRLLETVFDVIVDQCLLGLCDSLLYRLQLLSDIETRPCASIMSMML